jgi:hypothetical protein
MAYERDEHILGFGKKLAYSATSGGTYIEIDGTQEVNLPERELGAAEITNDDSVAYHKDYIPALYEPGTVSFTYVYGKTVFAAVEAVFQLASVAATRADATKFWKVTLSDGSIAAFQGFITKHDLPAELEDAIVVEGEIQVVGPMTFTAAA